MNRVTTRIKRKAYTHKFRDGDFEFEYAISPKHDPRDQIATPLWLLRRTETISTLGLRSRSMRDERFAELLANPFIVDKSRHRAANAPRTSARREKINSIERSRQRAVLGCYGARRLW